MFVKRIYLKDFLSFQEQEYVFVSGKPVLIQGINLSGDGEESNGSGKSTLQSALEYLLIKSTPSMDRDVNLIRWGCDNFYVEGEVFCPLRKQTLFISRTVNKKDSSKVVVKLNDIEVELANVNDSNKYILDWVGISKEDLQNYFIINKYRYTSFFYSSNTKKLELVTRISNTGIIDNAIVNVDKIIEEESKLKDKTKEDLITVQANIDLYNNLIETESSEQFEEEKKINISQKENEIESIKKDIAWNTDIISASKSKISSFNDELVFVNQQFNKAKQDLDQLNNDEFIVKLTEVNNEIKEGENIKNEISSEINQDQIKVNNLEQNIASVQKLLSGAVTCPKCDFKFLPGKNVDLEKEKESITKYQEAIKTVNSNSLELKTMIDEATLSIQKLISKKKLIQEEETKFLDRKRELQNNFDSLRKSVVLTENNINECNNTIKSKESSIVSLREQISFNEKLIEKINKEVFVSKINEYKKGIEDCEKVIIEQQKKLDKIILSISKKSEWIGYFKKFKFFIAQKTLNFIQSKVNEQLEQMKSSLRLKLEGFKQLANGDLKEEITPMVVKNGNVVSFVRLSGGQRARMDFAIIIVLQEIINQTNDYCGLDLIWTDEIFEGTDSMGMRLMLKSLEGLSKTILFTTHVNINDIHDNVLTVEYFNGISKIKEL